MRFFQNNTKETGSALILALILMAIGVILLTPVAVHVGTSIRNVSASSDELNATFSTDAGLEDAIWNLAYGDFATTVLADVGDIHSYTLDDTFNGNTVDIVISRIVGESFASDDMEDIQFDGGTGWVDAWIKTPHVHSDKHESPYEGKRQMQLDRTDTFATRQFSSDCAGAFRLEFWAKTKDFDQPEYAAYTKISANGTDWTTVRTWTDSDPDDVFVFEDIDLSAFATASQLWLRFESQLNSNDSQTRLFIDDLSLVSQDTFEIVVSAGGQTASAEVSVHLDCGINIHSWSLD